MYLLPDLKQRPSIPRCRTQAKKSWSEMTIISYTPLRKNPKWEQWYWKSKFIQQTGKRIRHLRLNRNWSDSSEGQLRTPFWPARREMAGEWNVCTILPFWRESVSGGTAEDWSATCLLEVRRGWGLSAIPLLFKPDHFWLNGTFRIHLWPSLWWQ